MNTHDLEEIIAELITRPGHEKVRAHLHRLLTDGLGARSTDIDFEKPVPEVRGRIDALLGRTVFEVKSDLRREHAEAVSQLERYLPERERAVGVPFVGVVTDGAIFQVYEIRDEAVQQLGSDFAPTVSEPRSVLIWLESVARTSERIPPDIVTIKKELGRESIAYHRALREIMHLWEDLAQNHAALLKRDLWNRLLVVAYGGMIGENELFYQHTYLTVAAKTIATLALNGNLPSDPEALLSGVAFRDLGIVGAVESDFFDWVLLTPEGRGLVERIAQHVSRFDFATVDVDILKGLYESLIDPAQRHDLGEYYTPDWLASRIVAVAVDDPLTERVIDPACGSGTFLFHALRQLLAHASDAGISAEEAVVLACDKVAGIDVHPVAVIFARATYLLALAPTLREGRPASVTVPVYLGDALQWSAREIMGAADLEIVVPAEGEAITATATDTLPEDADGEEGRRVILRFPFDTAADPGFFDEALDQMLTLGEHDRPASEFRAWVRGQSVPGEETLVQTYETLRSLQKQGRNHIWGYVARNLSRPIWLASEARKADVVVGNPPWLAYARMSGSMQVRFREEMKLAGLWGGVRSVSAYDLSAYFFARCVQLYLRRDGGIAFVMPYAAMSRDPYRLFRSGKFQDKNNRKFFVEFVEAWSFPADVSPLFPVPSCVLFADRIEESAPLPTTVRAYAGRLPRRDANDREADATLSEISVGWPSDDGEARQVSLYRNRFRQGAILIPRRFVIVERLPAGRLGANPAAPLVRGRVGSQDKPPWKNVTPPEGPVEAEFLRPVYLGESIAPFRVLGNTTAVVPWHDGTHQLLSSSAAAATGNPRLSQWLAGIDALWKEHGKGKRTFAEQLDFWEQLSSQFPPAEIRVCYAKAGKNPAASIISDASGIIDHKLYWAPCQTREEGYYLCAILNSETIRARAERWQSMGQWGARDFDKAMFNLPIPQFDDKIALHSELVDAAQRAEVIANAVVLSEGEYFTRARRRVRNALLENGVATEIDDLVARLLDGT